MLMPAGTPEDPKERTSREVKSGRRKVSFSNSASQGIFSRKLARHFGVSKAWAQRK